jgi:hypothetical protein
LKPAVLFLIFNRPDCTAAVFEEIRRFKPSKLYVAADGPRSEKESPVCVAVRKLVEIDWECEVSTLYRETNLGCKKAVSSAITWFFEHEEEGIILEDDCLPDPSFFNFCSEMLEKYRNVDEVAHIGGANFQDGKTYGDGSYYFSRLTHVWGWAGWRRIWNNYDPDIRDFPGFKPSDFKKIPSFAKFYRIWMENLNKVYFNKIDTWDYQYAYLNIKSNKISIIPNQNLIKNIGFGPGATNTTQDHIMGVQHVSSMLSIVDPKNVTVTVEADVYTQEKEFSHLPPRKGLLSRIWKKIKNR